MKLASTEIGSATPVMTVERHELRNRKTTSTVRNAPEEQRFFDVPHRVRDAHAGVLHDVDLRALRQRLLDLRRHARGLLATSVVL